VRIAFFGTHAFERAAFELENRAAGHAITFLDPRLEASTAPLASGHDVACSFVNDSVNAQAIEGLLACGIRLLALRSAGHDHVDGAAARRLGLPVVHVPDYSPHAVAEHAVALTLALCRNIHRAYVRVRDANFSLEGLVGFNLHGKTVGIVGTGRIGALAAQIFWAFGCQVIANDVRPDRLLESRLGLRYVDLDMLWRQSDVVSLHVPLTEATRHLVGASALATMKPEARLVNTARGAIVDTQALVDALKRGAIGGAALDVYEHEKGLFFEDHSNTGIADDLLARLVTMPNVIVTSHQGFLTKEALRSIARTTLANVTAFAEGRLENRVA